MDYRWPDTRRSIRLGETIKSRLAYTVTGLLPNDLFFINKEPVLVKLFDNLLRKVQSINLLVQMALSPLL